MDELGSYSCFSSEGEYGFPDASDLDPVNITLLPGEYFIQFDLLHFGCRFGLTNYRIIIIFDIIGVEKSDNKCDKFNIISVPLGLIYHIEYYGMVCVNILTKIGCRFNLTFPDIQLCEGTLKKIKEARLNEKYFGIEFYRSLKASLPDNFLIKGTYCNNDWKDEFDAIHAEFDRLEFSKELWRISDVNMDFKICSSYPQYHIILKDFSDCSVKEMAKFRSKGRFISTVYRSIETESVLLRAGQPLTGMSGWRNSSDEEYVQLIAKLNKSRNGDSKIIIFDARSYTSAQLNKVKGGGMEAESYYPAVSVEYLNIPNMHSVRSSLESLSNAIAGDSKNFYDLVDKSNWLLLIRDLIKSATLICNTMHTKGKTVLVHCSDGWDRTPQLTSLAMVLMDPYYRTIKGFKVLIQREWIYFGHRFDERCALWCYESGREYSPIFLQWLDCIHQLQIQFPDHFEFNAKFLIKLALHVYSGLFGTFNKSILYPDETCSLWNFICYRDIRAFTNPLYHPKGTFNIMKPLTHVAEMKIWTGLYREALDPYFRDIYSSENLNRELPPELNNQTMLSSIISDQEQDDDYDGEDMESWENCKPRHMYSQNRDEGDKGSCDNSIEVTASSYFRQYVCKSSLDTIVQIPSANDTQILEGIDFDALFIQRDVFFTFCETNRQSRHLLKRKAQHFKKKYLNICNQITTANEEIVQDTDDHEFNDYEITGASEDDNETIVSDNSVDIVLWVPDHAATTCTSCNARFSFALRKHHCRNCGKIFCGECSLLRAKVIRQRIDYPVRVCDACYKELKDYNEDTTKRRGRVSSFIYSLLFARNLEGTKSAVKADDE